MCWKFHRSAKSLNMWLVNCRPLSVLRLTGAPKVEKCLFSFWMTISDVREVSWSSSNQLEKESTRTR